jgi:hypothetical protein
MRISIVTLSAVFLYRLRSIVMLLLSRLSSSRLEKIRVVGLLFY